MPIRVLHIIDPATPGGGACTLRLLAEPLERLRSVQQDVLIIGNSRHGALARRCGVRPRGVLTTPRQFAGFAWTGLRRFLMDMARATPEIGREYDIIHAWTAHAAIAAILAGDSPRVHQRLATVSVGPVSTLAMSVLDRLLRDPQGGFFPGGPTPMLATSSGVKHEYIAMGLSEELLSVMAPAVNPESVEQTDRQTLRRRWNVTKKTLAIGLLSEPVSWADARAALGAVSMASVSGRDLRLIAHPTATRRLEARRWADKLNLGHLLILDDEIAEPWRVTAGLDAALLIGGSLNTMDLTRSGTPLSFITGGGRRLRPMPGVMPLLWALAAGVPVIAESCDAVRGIVKDGETGLLVDQGDTSGVSRHILRLCDDRTIGGRLGTAGRDLIHDRYHVSAYCVKLKEIYTQLMEQGGGGDGVEAVQQIAEFDTIIRRVESGMNSGS